MIVVNAGDLPMIPIVLLPIMQVTLYNVRELKQYVTKFCSFIQVHLMTETKYSMISLY